jgi:hypothetical protein
MKLRLESLCKLIGLRGWTLVLHHSFGQTQGLMGQHASAMQPSSGSTVCEALSDSSSVRIWRTVTAISTDITRNGVSGSLRSSKQAGVQPAACQPLCC